MLDHGRRPLVDGGCGGDDDDVGVADPGNSPCRGRLPR